LFFSLLMTLGLCPAWFLGLLITLAIVQGSAYLCVKLPRSHVPLSLPNTPVSPYLTVFQWTWIGLLFLWACLYRVPNAVSGVASVAAIVIYTSIAALHVYTFYLYFRKFRPLIIPDFRTSL
jgi:phosphatidylglycerophosphate synthase